MKPAILIVGVLLLAISASLLAGSGMLATGPFGCFDSRIRVDFVGKVTDLSGFPLYLAYLEFRADNSLRNLIGIAETDQFGDYLLHSSTSESPHVAGGSSIRISARSADYNFAEAIVTLPCASSQDPDPIIVRTNFQLAGASALDARFRFAVSYLEAYFQDQSLGGPTKWIWTFGDGTSETTTSPELIHRYPRAGTWSVMVEAVRTSDGSSDAAVTTITTTEPPPDPQAPQDPPTVGGIGPEGGLGGGSSSTTTTSDQDGDDVPDRTLSLVVIAVLIAVVVIAAILILAGVLV